MIFSFHKFLNLNFKNHHRKQTLKICDKPFFESVIIVSLIHLQLCHIIVIVKVYFKASRLNYITSFTISQYFVPATPPVSGIFERATWQP